jgi:hypothetical protein
MGDLPDGVYDVMGSTIHDMAGAEFNQPAASLRSTGHGDNRGTGLRGKLDGGKAHAAGCRLDEDSFSACESAAREKAVMRRPERDRQYRRIRCIHSIGYAPCTPRWHSPERSMRALHVKCRDPIPYSAACDIRSSRHHCARRRVSDNPGRLRWRSRAAVDQVATFN